MQKKHKITRKTTNMAMSSTDEGPHANDLFSRTNETPQRLTAKPLTPVVRIYLKIYLSNCHCYCQNILPNMSMITDIVPISFLSREDL